MRVIIQRVSKAKVTVEEKVVGEIKKGFLVLLGIENEDDESDATWLAQKIVNMRVFKDEEDKMNLSVQDVNGELLVVSQFTLHALTKKGNRPSFIKAARPEKAIPLYEYFLQQVKQLTGKAPATGEFGAMMQVELINSGPVTIFMDSKNKH